MQFITVNGAIINVGAIESITDKPGNLATVNFIGGRTLDVTDAVAKGIGVILAKNNLVLS